MILNDIVFLTIHATSLFFVSFPLALVESQQKTKPLHTDTFAYLVVFGLSVGLLTVHLEPNNNYVFSRKYIATWGAGTWGLFVLNVVVFLPVMGRNLWLAHFYRELKVHVAGYVIFVLLFVLAFTADGPKVHLHHWVSSSFLMCFSRFCERESRLFHALCLGIFIHGITFFGPDPIFE